MAKSFDRTRLRLRPLAERDNDLGPGAILPLEGSSGYESQAIEETAARIIKARQQGAEVVMMMGGHVIRAGVQRHIIDLMERGLLTCLSMNGSCIIHDYEFALTGGTTESVARYIKDGSFGLWKETGELNEIINQAFQHDGTGMDSGVMIIAMCSEIPYLLFGFPEYQSIKYQYKQLFASPQQKVYYKNLDISTEFIMEKFQNLYSSLDKEAWLNGIKNLEEPPA